MDLIKDKKQYVVASRRSFLKLLGAGVAAVTVLSSDKSKAAVTEWTGSDSESGDIFLHGSGIRFIH